MLLWLQNRIAGFLQDCGFLGGGAPLAAKQDCWIFAGLQDITAHVDFTSLAQTAIDNGLDVAGFQSQADFLLAAGITELTSFDDHDDAFIMLQQATEIKRLTLPTEMGETFKVLTLTKNLDQLFPRIQLGDRRYIL